MSSSTPKKPLIEFKGLCKAFQGGLFSGKKIALSEFTWQMNQGQLGLVLGHNGAGKSTFIKSILGLVNLDKGEIFFQGSPIKTDDRSRIGYMPDDTNLPGGIKVKEQLSFHAALYEQSKGGQRVEQTLCEVGLSSMANKTIKNLSKGQARRLSWAMAYIHRPRLLILDEPFSGLDPLGKQDMRKWIESQLVEGVGIILCTHELDCLPLGPKNLVMLREGSTVLKQTSDKIPEFETLIKHYKQSGVTQ